MTTPFIVGQMLEQDQIITKIITGTGRFNESNRSRIDYIQHLLQTLNTQVAYMITTVESNEVDNFTKFMEEELETITQSMWDMQGEFNNQSKYHNGDEMMERIKAAILPDDYQI